MLIVNGLMTQCIDIYIATVFKLYYVKSVSLLINYSFDIKVTWWFRHIHIDTKIHK